jgi:hypothetical protein
MFATGTAAKVGAGYYNVTGLNGGSKVDINVFHAMGGQCGRRRIIKMTGRDDNIGVNVGAVFVNLHEGQLLS